MLANNGYLCIVCTYSNKGELAMDFDKLNKQQLQAATYKGKHLLVLAGAGTGKTRTIIARAVHLLQSGTNAHRIKILSFTRKSAQEIAERIKIESEGLPDAKRMSGSTFHSWCMELIMRYSEAFGLEGYSCIDEDDRETAIKLVIGRLYGKKEVKLKGQGSKRIKAGTVSEVYSYSVNTRCNITTAIKAKMFPLMKGEEVDKLTEEAREVIVEIIKGYIEYKREHKYLDYDDMLSAVASVLKRNDGLRNMVASQYDHILVDEMQDTNPLQWMLLESFFDRCHLFCVGDDAQSIYAFRGADFKSIHSFKERVPNAEIYKLEENYRSTQEILDLSNWLLKQSPLNYNKELFANRGRGLLPVMKYVDNDWEEADFITDDILDNIQEGKKFREHMILTRAIYQARKLEAACISKKIPYQIFGGTGLMRSAHVRDVVSAMRVISNHRDELAWTRYLTLWDGVGEVTAATLIGRMLLCDNVNDCISIVEGAKLKNAEAYKALNAICTLNTDPSAAIDVLIELMEGILKKRYDNWDLRKKDFVALKLVAQKAVNISDFVTDYILDPSADITLKFDTETDTDKITISTIHSAKGLESEICYILNVNPESYPSLHATTLDEIEEERRCLYVALTRAKDELYLMSSFRSRMGFAASGREFLTIDIDRRIISAKDPNIRGHITWLDNKHGEMIISYCIDGEEYVCSCTEKEFNKKFKLLSKSEEAGMNYFFNDLPTELLEFPSNQRQKQIIETKKGDFGLGNWDPFAEINFS